MSQAFQIAIAVTAIAVFVGLLLRPGRITDLNAVIDPDNPRQLGALIGLAGGSIEDAALARHALLQFEKEHGRKATIGDMGVVSGMVLPRRR